jgi:hypothetical protein
MVSPATKGVVLSLSTKKKKRTISKRFSKIHFKRDPIRTLNSIRNVLIHQRHRPDLKRAALRRATALYETQARIKSMNANTK